MKQKTGNSNVSNEEILQLKHARDKIEEQLEYILKKEEEFLEKEKN